MFYQILFCFYSFKKESIIKSPHQMGGETRFWWVRAIELITQHIDITAVYRGTFNHIPPKLPPN